MISTNQPLSLSSSKRPLESPDNPASSRPRLGSPLEEENAHLNQEAARLHQENIAQVQQTAPLGSIINNHSAHLFTENIEWLTYRGQNPASTAIYPVEFEQITCQHWDEFDEEIAGFYQQDDVVEALRQLYRIPKRPTKAYCVTEASYSALFFDIFNQTINLYFVDSPDSLYMAHHEYPINSVKPDFWFTKTRFYLGSTVDCPRILDAWPVLPIEVKRPAVFGVIESLVEFIARNRDSSNIDPVLQLTAHMHNSGRKYGVLTTGYQTWIFKKVNDNIYVISSTQSQENWLRTMYFACWISRKDHIEHPGPRKPPYIIPTPSKRATSKTADEQEGDESTSSAFSARHSQATTAKFQARKHDIQLPEFPKIELEITDQLLGKGRSSSIYLGYLKQQDDERIAVAVKECKGDSVTQDEMVNEARVLLYANQRGVKAAPRIYYSGYHDELFVNVLELFDSEEFYQDIMCFWSQHEIKLFDAALQELKDHMIDHRDIRGTNVFFSRDGLECKIIDYGFSRIKPLQMQPVS